MISLPDSLRAALAQADEGYLIGLCNKGTVNRARKDLAGLSPAAESEGDGISVTLGEVRCTIRTPLGDSVCSCPAPGMCRHRIAAILWLQGLLAEAGDAPASEESAAPDPSPLLEEPVEKLRRAMGTRAYHELVFRLGREGLPPMEEGSAVRVSLPEGITVKLLTPLEHASCTCRSRELCRHKAAALLCWQIKRGRHTLEELAEGSDGAGGRWDAEQVSAAASAVEALTAELLETGLSRLSASAPESAQRLAALCHTASLPRLENGLRTLGTLLERALGRSAAFRTEELLIRLAELHHLARVLEEARDPETMQEAAGVFREVYGSCPDLRLSLLGEREFRADSGYAGTVYYFWEMDREQWYTYTAVRPDFYGKKRFSAARAPAPWGLDGTMDHLYGLTLNLTGARAARGGRLSATEECRAAVGGSVQPWEALPERLCWRDFAAMFRAMAPYLLEGEETEKLALIRPERCVPRTFDRTRQLFCLVLEDEAGRALPLEVRYSADARALVRTLEEIVRRLEEEPEASPAFLCLLHLEEDGLKLYPVEYYPDWRCGP